MGRGRRDISRNHLPACQTLCRIELEHLLTLDWRQIAHPHQAVDLTSEHDLKSFFNTAGMINFQYDY